MVTRELVSLEETATMELQGATQRLGIAQRELADFHAQHDGVAHHPHLADSLTREKFALELELDSAARAYNHAFQEVLRHQQMPAAR